MCKKKELFKKSLNWKKQGLIFKPMTELWWMQSHVAAPTADHIRANIYRIYFCGRDGSNRSQIGWFDVSAENGTLEVVNYSQEPILQNGDLGCFDDNGVTPSCVVDYESKKFLYYIGWNPGSTVRMNIFGGLAIKSSNSGKFKRYSKAPIIERNKINPYINTSPFVLRDIDFWRMYYVAGVEWVHKDLPRYNIQYAESLDGLEWQRQGHVCIDFKNDEETALARPYVLKDDGVYKMWFCHKGDDYRMGYAESLDGINWERQDELAGLEVSVSGWDSQMVAYPCVFRHDDFYYLLYNGDNYGFSGAGYASSKCEY